MDDVPAVVEDPPDVFSVHGACKVWVAVVAAISASGADPLKTQEKMNKNCIIINLRKPEFT